MYTSVKYASYNEAKVKRKYEDKARFSARD